MSLFLKHGTDFDTFQVPSPLLTGRPIAKIFKSEDPINIPGRIIHPLREVEYKLRSVLLRCYTRNKTAPLRVLGNELLLFDGIFFAFARCMINTMWTVYVPVSSCLCVRQATIAISCIAVEPNHKDVIPRQNRSDNVVTQMVRKEFDDYDALGAVGRAAPPFSTSIKCFICILMAGMMQRRSQCSRRLLRLHLGICGIKELIELKYTFACPI